MGRQCHSWLPPYVQSLPASDAPKFKAEDCPTDAVFAYVALAGDDGVRWLEKEVLNNSKAHRHRDAIVALSAHAESGQFVSREIALRGLRTALNAAQPDFFAIYELEKLKDWTAVQRVAQIGVEAARMKEDSSELLAYALRYLFASPRTTETI